MSETEIKFRILEIAVKLTDKPLRPEEIRKNYQFLTSLITNKLF